MTEGNQQLSRRDWLGIVAAGTSAAVGLVNTACRTDPSTRSQGPAAGPSNELTDMSATGLAKAIRSKQVSSGEVVDAHLRRIEQVNPQINAVVQLVAEQARAQAREADSAISRGDKIGPLHGIPMTIKDSLDTAGVITTAGTKGREKYIPATDATVVKRLRESGAILLGKTNTPEITLAGETDNLVYGRTSNPYDLSRSTGGSSGGAVAIVAAGGSPFDIGSDSGGSIRFPCSFCGVAGIKPTSGRVPLTGHIISYEMGSSESWTQLGPIARYVEDLALILPLIAGPDWSDPYAVPAPLGAPDSIEVRKLRISFHTDNGVTSTAETVREVVRNAANALSALGSVVEEIRPPGIQEFLADPGAGDGGALFRSILRSAGTVNVSDVSPFLRAFFDPQAKSASAAELEAYLVRTSKFRSRMLSFMEQFDVIVCPAFGQPAPPHGFWNKVRFPVDVSYTWVYNVTGWPAAVVRCGTSPEGLPIGVQIVARPFREDVALAVALHLERELGGFEPPTL